MNLENLQDKKIAILGLGIENYALVRFLLKKKVRCEITICDARKNIQKETNFPIGNLVSKKITWQLGKSFNKNLTKFDILFRSPGWPIACPRVQQALKKGVILSSPMKLFFEICPAKNIIGITGTKGKGTTASLVYHILKRAMKRVWLGGNIGVAPFEFIDKIKKSNWVVLELSSFQLEDMTVSPRISVITNFTSEHLAPADPNNPNYHKTIRDYWQAKLNIVKWQKKGDYIIVNRKLKAKFQNFAFKNELIYFDKSDLESKLIGEHNKENVASAIEVVKIIGIKQKNIKKAVASFKSLEHRLEYIKTVKGVKYYNDSFATTPESTITALESFNQPIVLLAGGAEKDSDFKKLAREIKKKVRFVVLLDGKATARLRKELLNTGFNENKIKLVSNIKDAVSTAQKNASIGNIVLLSTACASFGMFKNYKERGRLFKSEINKLK